MSSLGNLNVNLGTAPNLAQGIGGYTSAYQSALSAASQNYSAVMQGYQNALNAQQQGYNALLPQYGALEKQVLGGIQNITASQSQAIKDQYAQQWGGTNQQLINSGLGNTTVTQSLQRGLTLDEQKAQVALANQQAQLTAGYQSQLGLAGLSAKQQAISANSALAAQAMQTRAGFQIPFPSPGPFMQMQAWSAMRAQDGGTSINNPGMRPFNTPNPSNPNGPVMPGAYGYGNPGGGGFYASQSGQAPGPQADMSMYGGNWAGTTGLPGAGYAPSMDDMGDYGGGGSSYA